LTIQAKTARPREAYPPRDGASAERDRLLVEAHLLHDTDAFAIIVDDHWASLIGQARRMLGPDGAAEDMVQETFERALKYLPRFGRSGDYRLGAWLSQILRRVVQNHWERTSRESRSAQLSAGQAVFEVDVAERVGDPVIAAALRRQIRGLPDSQRAAFVMREVVGLPYADVAEALNISEENVRARVSRSKGRLRRSSAGFRSAVGAVLGLPAGYRALQTRFATKVLNREKGHALGAGDRVATQFTGTPLGQSVLNLLTSTPRGTLVFGLAATVATLSASTAVLTTAGPSPAGPGAAMALVSAQVPAAQTPLVSDTTGSAAAPATSSSTSPYDWVNAGTGPGQGSGSAVAGLAATQCSASDGVAPPGSAFSYGAPLGLSDALAVANAPAVDLSTVGSSLSFATATTIAPFGGGTPTGVSVVSNVCLSSDGPDI